jgi:NAD(P)-dependent dehydrogenase (short-subunit alcohol dehydrogenase family)
MGRFDGKLVLLVGGYSGIAATAARRLANEGASLVLLGRQEEKLKETLATLSGSRHEIVVADAAFSEQLQPAVQIGRKRGGYAGAVVCAGSHVSRPLSVLSREGIAQAFEANVTTALLATAAFAKAAAKDGGSIVWFSSVAALRGTATFAAYSAAKGALISAARVAAIELASRRIRVNVIAAGVVDTPMSAGWLAMLNEEQKAALKHRHLLGIGRPEDLAGVIAFLLSDDARWITGSVVTADGGLATQ